MDKLAVVIVNWNTGKLLARCVSSLFSIRERDRITDIVVADNASTDASMAHLKKELGTQSNKTLVHLIESSQNLGFAGGNNKGIEYLQEKYGDTLPHVLLLNPDTETHSEAITSLLAVLQAQERVGVVGPKLLNTDGTVQPSVRSFPTIGIVALTLLKLTRLLKGSAYWQHYLQHDFDYTRAQAVDQVMGAAFLIRNTLLRDVGLLDDGYFVWFEEVDYCKRVQEKGWMTWYTPAGRITHHGGVSFAQLVGVQRTMPWLKSSLRYAKKHLGIVPTLFLYTLAPITLLLSIPASIFHEHLKSLNKARLNA